MTRSGGKLSRKQKKGLKRLEEPQEIRSKNFPEPAPAKPEAAVGKERIDPTDVAEPVESGIPLSARFSLAAVQGRILAMVATAIICSLVYANSLQAPFVFDDLHNFIENPYTQIEEVSAEKLWYAASRSPSSSRWLPNMSFALNYYFGEKDPTGYHLVNLVIHLLAGLLVYLLALQTLSLPDMTRYGEYRYEVSLIAAALWLLHPVQTNAVTYLVQRMTSMAALFCLLSLLLYVYGRSAVGKRKYYFSGALITGLMALVSKENSYMLPVMIGGYELFFLRSDFKVKFTLKNAGWVAATGGLLLVVALLFVGPDVFSSLLGGYQTRDFTLGERLLTESRVVIFYLTILLFPAVARLNLTHDFPISTGLFSPPGTFLAIACLAGLGYLVCRLYNSNRLLSFALFWFFINLLIESTIIPLELVFEHRLYLPSVFIFVGLTATSYQYFSKRVYLPRIMVAVIMISLAVLTWQRNETWKDGMTFWNDVLKKSPNNARAYNNLAEVYTARNDFAKSLYYYQKALVNKPPQNSLPIILKNLGFALIVHGRYDEAMQHLIRSIRLNPNDPKTHLNLGIVYKKKGDRSRANYHYGQARNLQANLFR